MWEDNERWVFRIEWKLKVCNMIKFDIDTVSLECHRQPYFDFPVKLHIAPGELANLCNRLASMCTCEHCAVDYIVKSCWEVARWGITLFWHWLSIQLFFCRHLAGIWDHNFNLSIFQDTWNSVVGKWINLKSHKKKFKNSQLWSWRRNLCRPSEIWAKNSSLGIFYLFG